MPDGISVAVEDGFATIEFLDPTLKGPTLAALLQAGGPGLIDTDTSGERRSYVVPESIATQAGLIDATTGSKKTAARKTPSKKAAKK